MLLPVTVDARVLAGWAVGGVVIACSPRVNHPPSLAYLAPLSVVVGDRLELAVEATDPDGDALAFGLAGLPEGAALVASGPTQALLLWSPLITDTEPGGRIYLAELAADDQRGGRATASVEVAVRATAGVPVFDLPAGVVLDLDQHQDLRLVVAVKDDDSSEVALSLVEAPAGATLQALDAKQGYFRWEPSEEAELQVVHHARFRAEDGDHPPVDHTLMLVLLHPEGDGGCTGTPPFVLHAPPADQIVSTLAVEISATVLDAESAPTGFEVLWGVEGAESLGGTSELVESSKISGLFAATLALGELPPEGALVSYWFEGSDNDNPIGSTCDHAVRYPKTGWLTAAFYPPSAPLDACQDDGQEPDGEESEAPDLPPGVYPGRRLCGADRDLARVTVEAGATLAARVVRDPAHGSVTLALRDGSGGLLAEDTSQAAVLRVEDSSDAGGVRYVEVAGAPGGRLGYQLEILAEEVPCPSDPSEPNDTAAEATQVGAGSLAALVLCPGEEDWFEVALDTGMELKAAIVFEHPYGDLDLELHDDVALVARSATLQSVESLQVVSGSPHSVWLRVLGASGAGNAYALTVETGPAGLACKEDVLAPNFAPELAAVVFQGFYDGLVVCPNAADWYAVELNGGETVALQIETNQNPMWLDLYQDPAGPPIASAATDPQGKAALAHPGVGAGTLRYRVWAQNPPTEYQLTQVVSDPAGPCAPDRFEPNDGLQDAVVLDPGVHTWLRLCPDDVDAFRVKVPPLATLRIVTQHGGSQGAGDLLLLAPDGVTEVGSAQDGGHGVELVAVAGSAGLYTLVFQASGVDASLPYDLAVEIE